MRLRLKAGFFVAAASGCLLLAGAGGPAAAQDQSSGQTINFEAPPPPPKKLVAKTVTTPLYRVVDGNHVDPNTSKAGRPGEPWTASAVTGPSSRGWSDLR